MLVCVCVCVCVSYCSDASLEKQGVWSQAIKPDASLLSVQGIAKLPAADLLRLVQLLECLLLQHAARVAAVSGAHDMLCRYAMAPTLPTHIRAPPCENAASRAWSCAHACVLTRVYSVTGISWG